MKLRHLYISPGHNYVGHEKNFAGDHPIIEVDQMECVAGLGIREDRYFNHKPDYKGQITFFSWEIFQQLCQNFGLIDTHPSAMRRNVLIEGVDLNDWIGQEFAIQNVRFLGTEECRPCFWMDQAIAQGAHQWLKGRGGLRAKILTNGVVMRDA